MLTGTRTFGGEDISDTLAFVITKEPYWTALPADTPAPIRKLLRRSLLSNLASTDLSSTPTLVSTVVLSKYILH